MYTSECKASLSAAFAPLFSQKSPTRLLVEVGGQPVHDDVEGIVEGEVVDHDGPHRGVGHHAGPGGRPGSSLVMLTRLA